MYSALCIAACLAVLVVGTAAGALLSNAATFVCMRRRQEHPGRVADTIFFLRLFPFAFGLVLSIGVALPAFLLLEPLSTGEPISARLLLLASISLAGIGLVGARLALSIFATHKQVRTWTRSAQRLTLPNLPEMFVLPERRALLAVVGTLRPRLFISADVLSALDADELAAAVKHEMAHVTAFDNLKHLAIRITRPPTSIAKWLGTKRSWLHAAEIAADHAALRNGTSALDLASALVKVANISCRVELSAAVNASHLIPAGAAGQLPARISHLQRWVERYPNGPLRDQKPAPGVIYTRRLLIPLAALAAYAATLLYGLPFAHDLIEALVR